ncbi:hypothetical protein BDV18DRAFT_143973 [Aspergillus unguis]
MPQAPLPPFSRDSCLFFRCVSLSGLFSATRSKGFFQGTICGCDFREQCCHGSPQIQDPCYESNPSLANMDRISALLAQEKILFHPQDQDLDGLYFERVRQYYLQV